MGSNFLNFLRTDLFAILACVFVLVIWKLLPWVNDPSQAAKEQTKSEGKLTIELEWQAGKPTDIDLWVQSPGDPPVGYSNKGWINCNLLRDDVGLTGDPFPGNHEMTVCRKIKPGLWVVNVHHYGGQDLSDTEAWVVIRRITPGGNSKVVFQAASNLRHGQEDTIAQFTVTPEGEIINVNRLKKSLGIGGIHSNEGM